MSEKLTEIGQMFESRNNLSQMERILLNRNRQETGSVTPVDYEKSLEQLEVTEEELEIEEERKIFREMLIGRTHSESEIKLSKPPVSQETLPETGKTETWAVPADWSATNDRSSTVPIEENLPIKTTIPVETESEMWFPTPQIEFEDTGNFSTNSEPEEIPGRGRYFETGNFDEGDEYYEQTGEMYHEHTRTVFPDGTVVNNIITGTEIFNHLKIRKS